MATRSFKVVLNNSILLKNSTSSPRGFTQQRPFFFLTIAGRKDENVSRLTSAQTRNLHENLIALAASRTPALSTLRNHQRGGVRLIHDQTRHNNNKKDTLRTPNPHQDAIADTNEATAEAGKPVAPPPGKPCTCPDCRWFPFHRGTLPRLLSDGDRDRLLQLAEDIVRYTPISEGPSTPPFDLVLRQRLGHDWPPPPSSSPSDHPPPPSPSTNPVGEGGRQGGSGEDGDKMPRSGYDMTSMLRAGQKPRPAGSGAEGVEGEEEQMKKQVTTKAGDGSDENKNNDNNDNDNNNNGPAPLQKKERTVDDVRVHPGTGWTFWL